MVEYLLVGALLVAAVLLAALVLRDATEDSTGAMGETLVRGAVHEGDLTGELPDPGVAPPSANDVSGEVQALRGAPGGTAPSSTSSTTEAGGAGAGERAPEPAQRSTQALTDDPSAIELAQGEAAEGALPPERGGTVTAAPTTGTSFLTSTVGSGVRALSGEVARAPPEPGAVRPSAYGDWLDMLTSVDRYRARSGQLEPPPGVEREACTPTHRGRSVCVAPFPCALGDPDVCARRVLDGWTQSETGMRARLGDEGYDHATRNGSVARILNEGFFGPSPDRDAHVSNAVRSVADALINLSIGTVTGLVALPGLLFEKVHFLTATRAELERGIIHHLAGDREEGNRNLTSAVRRIDEQGQQLWAIGQGAYDFGAETYDHCYENFQVYGCGKNSTTLATAIGGFAHGLLKVMRGWVRGAGEAAVTKGRTGERACARGVCKEPNSECFGAGTPVATASGAAPIETLRAGDWVLTRDPLTHEAVPRRVRQASVTASRKALRLTLVAPNAGRDEELVVTGDHPFFHASLGWTGAGSLKVGDAVLTVRGTWTVGGLERIDEPTLVYNLEVEEHHTYFVGGSRAWVHNNDCISVASEGPRRFAETFDGRGVLARVRLHSPGELGSAYTDVPPIVRSSKGQDLRFEKVVPGVRQNVRQLPGGQNAVVRTKIKQKAAEAHPALATALRRHPDAVLVRVTEKNEYILHGPADAHGNYNRYVVQPNGHTTAAVYNRGGGIVAGTERQVSRDFDANPALIVDDLPPTLFAVSDIHGALPTFVTLARRHGLVRTDDLAQPVWTGGNATLLVMGDLFNKGTHSLGTIRYLRALQEDAASKGGRVIVTMGNHEGFFLSRPYGHRSDGKPRVAARPGASDRQRDTPMPDPDPDRLNAQLRAEGIRPEDVAHGRDPEGIGQWLRDLPVAARLGDIDFIHAGSYHGRTLSQVDEAARRAIARDGYDSADLIGDKRDPQAMLNVSGFEHPRQVAENHAATDARVTVFGHVTAFREEHGGVGVGYDGRLLSIDSHMNIVPDRAAMIRLDTADGETSAVALHVDGRVEELPTAPRGPWLADDVEAASRDYDAMVAERDARRAAERDARARETQDARAREREAAAEGEAAAELPPPRRRGGGRRRSAMGSMSSMSSMRSVSGSRRRAQR